MHDITKWKKLDRAEKVIYIYQLQALADKARAEVKLRDGGKYDAKDFVGDSLEKIETVLKETDDTIAYMEGELILDMIENNNELL